MDVSPVLVAESAVLAQAGTPSEVWPGTPVTYALGPTGLVVVIDAGDRPDSSAVYARDEVRLRPPFPDPVVAALTAHPDRATIHGFVRMHDGPLPLGRLRVFMTGSSQAPGDTQSRFQECHLSIVDRLPLPVLDLVRPVPVVEPPDLAWLDLLPGDPIGALRGFVTGWFADVPAQDAPAPDAPVPAALAALYQVAAGRCEPLGCFNRIFTPDQFLAADNGHVVFGTECQGVWNLLMDPSEPDPLVVYSDLDGDGPVVERERLAGFLMQFSVDDAAMASPYGGLATVDRETVQHLAASLSPVPLQPLRYPADPNRLFVGPGLVIAICPPSKRQPPKASPTSSRSTPAPGTVSRYAPSASQASTGTTSPADQTSRGSTIAAHGPRCRVVASLLRMRSWWSVLVHRRQLLARLAADAYCVGFGSYIVIDAVRAGQAWATTRAHHALVATGIFTDLAQAFVGRAGAIALEVLVGVGIIAAGLVGAAKSVSGAEFHDRTAGHVTK